MKKLIKTALAIALCMIMLSVSALPALAKIEEETPLPSWATPTDAERFREFFSQTDARGITNGDRLLAYAERCPFCTVRQYDPNDLDCVWHTPAFERNTYSPQGSMTFCSTFQHIHNTAANFIYNTAYYGTMNFTGTSLSGVDLETNYNIDEVLLDDCAELRYIIMNDVRNCDGLSALNTPRLETVTIGDSELNYIEVEPKGADHPLRIDIAGDGYIRNFLIPRANERPNADGVPFNVTVERESTRFVGWYSGGKCVSKERRFEGNVNEVHDLTAMFTGDADGDGEITASDALRVMRASMGIDIEPMGSADLDGNGIADMADALALMRFTMGL